MITHSNISKIDNKCIQVVSWPKAQVDNRPLVYDCFMFFNELDILEIRLNILDPVVDIFVLVESDVTNTGKPKELIFTKNKNRFTQFNDKIIHLVYSPLADGSDISSYPKWYLENTQRDAIMVGLANCRHDDVILISDVDEIPDPNTVRLSDHV